MTSVTEIDRKGEFEEPNWISLISWSSSLEDDGHISLPWMWQKLFCRCWLVLTPGESTQNHIHVKIVAKLWLERRSWTITWGSTTLQWWGWKALTNVKNAHMKPKIRPTWANTPNVCTVCTVKNQRRSRSLGNVESVEKHFSTKAILTHM